MASAPESVSLGSARASQATVALIVQRLFDALMTAHNTAPVWFPQTARVQTASATWAGEGLTVARCSVSMAVMATVPVLMALVPASRDSPAKRASWRNSVQTTATIRRECASMESVSVVVDGLEPRVTSQSLVLRTAPITVSVIGVNVFVSHRTSVPTVRLPPSALRTVMVAVCALRAPACVLRALLALHARIRHGVRSTVTIMEFVTRAYVFVALVSMGSIARTISLAQITVPLMESVSKTNASATISGLDPTVLFRLNARTTALAKVSVKDSRVFVIVDSEKKIARSNFLV